MAKAKTSDDCAAGFDWTTLHQRMSALTQSLVANRTLSEDERIRILEARARTLARSAPADDRPQETRPLVIFPVGRAHYAVPAESVDEVVVDAAVTPIPGIPSTVAGILMHRGRAVSVIALDRLLGIDDSPQADQPGTPAPSVIVLKTPNARIGLQVAGRTAFRDVAAALKPAAPGGRDGNLVVAMTDGMVRLLDPEAIAASPSVRVSVWPGSYTTHGDRP